MRPFRIKIKNRFTQAAKTLLLCSIALVPLSAFAWEYDSEAATTTQAVQLRTGAAVNKKWHNGLRLGISEEVRFDVYNSMVGPHFRKSYTTIDLGYKPIEYVKFDAGYTFRIIGADSTWSAAKKADVNEWMRHRVFFSVTGTYTFDYAKIYLRERAQLDMRTDSVNPLEKNKFDWVLRSRVGSEFIIPGKPVKPYLWVELINTLNAPEYQQKNGHQFISDVRTQAGIKWRVSRLSTLDFYYRFTYGYDRDINITKNKGKIELTEETLYMHSIGITYNLDW
jgi:hypothetical protein